MSLVITKETPTWVHSCHIRAGSTNACIVKEKVIQEYSDGKIGYTDRLNIIRDPRRSFWMTKPHAQTHEFKKEYEELVNLDQWNIPDSQLETALKTALDYNPYKKMSLKQLCNNPFIYGADIETGVLIRAKYKAQQGETVVPYTTGCLDIENEVRGNQRINVITFIHEKEIYTAVMDEYLVKEDATTGERLPANEQDLCEVIEEQVGSFIRKHGFNTHLYISDELDCIKWIFCNIHKHKTDFIGIWNIGHDIPHIIKRITELGGDPAKIMCHPDIPPQFQYVKYHADKMELQHITDKWDWFECPGYSQFVDAMCLYARIRKTKGREPYYNLDYISSKEIKTGKLHFGAITNHWHEQHHNFLRYVAYNINDCMIMQVMEWQNHDFIQLVALTGVSMLKDFNKQTVMVKNNTYIYARAQNKVIASAGTSMLTPFDAMLPKSGGAVLPPNKVRDIGSAVLMESSLKTYVVLSVNDLDVSAEYPSITASFNISKETKKSTVVSIDGFTHAQLENFFGDITSPIENAVPLCHTYFGLPNYEQMRQLFSAYLTQKMLRVNNPTDTDIYDEIPMPINSRIPSGIRQVIQQGRESA